MRLMHGKSGVRSALGTGSVFWCTLPANDGYRRQASESVSVVTTVSRGSSRRRNSASDAHPDKRILRQTRSFVMPGRIDAVGMQPFLDSVETCAHFLGIPFVAHSLQADVQALLVARNDVVPHAVVMIDWDPWVALVGEQLGEEIALSLAGPIVFSARKRNNRILKLPITRQKLRLALSTRAIRMSIDTLKIPATDDSVTQAVEAVRSNTDSDAKVETVRSNTDATAQKVEPVRSKTEAVAALVRDVPTQNIATLADIDRRLQDPPACPVTAIGHVVLWRDAKAIVPPPGPAPEHCNILVVEDNAVNRKIVMRIVSNAGVVAVPAEDGKEGFERYAGNPGSFSLVFMDLQMPVVGGIDSTRMIRAHEREHGLRPVPIFALTASTIGEIEEECRLVGMDGFIAKPFRKPDIERLIALACGKATPPTAAPAATAP
eukprot:Opistho-1_new@61948